MSNAERGGVMMDSILTRWETSKLKNGDARISLEICAHRHMINGRMKTDGAQNGDALIYSEICTHHKLLDG